MPQSRGLQRVRHDLVTEQQHRDRFALLLSRELGQWELEEGKLNWKTVRMGGEERRSKIQKWRKTETRGKRRRRGREQQ